MLVYSIFFHPQRVLQKRVIQEGTAWIRKHRYTDCSCKIHAILDRIEECESLQNDFFQQKLAVQRASRPVFALSVCNQSVFNVEGLPISAIEDKEALKNSYRGLNQSFTRERGKNSLREQPGKVHGMPQHVLDSCTYPLVRWRSTVWLVILFRGLDPH